MSDFKSKVEEQAIKYAQCKSSSSVFREAHIKDFTSGYNQALKDTKAPEILEMLKDIKDYLGSDKRKEVEQLIKEATEL